MEQDKLNVALIVMDEYDREFYEAVLSAYPQIALETYPSLQQLKDQCGGKRYSGFIVDLQTLIVSPTPDKEFYYSLRNAFPVMKVNRTLDKKEVHYVSEDQRPGPGEEKDLLDHFISIRCTQKGPRQVRLYPRKNIHFNTYLHRQREGNTVKTNLLNISEGGCFVITIEDPPEDRMLWLTITELRDRTPIRCETKWAMPWGKGYGQMSGYGVAFKEITEDQRREIKKAMEH